MFLLVSKIEIMGKLFNRTLCTVKPKNVNTKNINTGLFLTTFIKIALCDLCTIASSLNLSTLYAQCFILSMLILNAQQVQLSIMLRNK